MATYHVYLNWNIRGYTAKVHLSECAFCNRGKGIHPHASNRSGRWYGPFDTFRIAYDAAQQLARYRSKCQHCKPN